MSNAVQVIKKQITVEGRVLDVLLVDLMDGSEQGMPQARFVDLIGVSKQTLDKHLKHHSLLTSALGWPQIRDLRKLKLVGSAARQVNFLPKETIKALVKLIDTPTAWAINNQLWDDAETLHEIKTNPEVATQFLGDVNSDLMQRFTDAMREKEQRIAEETARADKAEEMVTQINLHAVTNAIKNGFKSWQIVSLYPEAKTASCEWGRSIGIYPNRGYEPQGVMTRWLREVHGVHALTPRLDYNSKRGDTALYDQGVIESLMLKLNYTRKETK